MHIAVFAIGFCGVVAQVVVVREMVVTFYGNELCVGAMLGTWLFWTGLGSLGLGRLARRLKQPGVWLVATFGIMLVLLVATALGARYLKVALRAGEGASLGQIRPFGTMLASSLLLLGPFCLANGFLFPLACRAAEAAGGTVGTVYLLEAAGAAVGGASYTFVLVHCLGLPGVFRQTDSAYWRPLAVVASADSPYGRLTVTRQAEGAQRTLYVNGVLAFSYPDPPVAEGVAHLPMLQHPEPRRVLLLGGGPGAVEEALKHPSVEKLTYVELDPLAVEMVRRHFPPGAANALGDRRVEVVLADGRAFVKDLGSHLHLAHSRHVRNEDVTPRFDVAISALGPPATAQANRFYTVEFFREVARVLEPGGVFAFQASGGHDYIPEESRRLLACLHGSLAAAFAHVIVFPGAPVTFLASNRDGVATHRLGVLDARMAQRGIATSYVDAHSWEADLVGGRLERLEQVVSAPAERNRDLSPRCYYYEAQRWSAQQRARQPGARPPVFDLGRVLEFLDRYPFVAPLALLAIVAAISMAAPLARRRWRDGALAFSVASTGLIEMGVEFTVLLGFQVACGYMYHYIGLLVASFMFGLTLGAWVSSRWVARGQATWRRMVGVQVCICGYPLVLLGLLWVATGTGLGTVPAVAGVSFSLAALIAGGVGGLQFPLAAALHSRGAGSAGALYGLDLFGACLGALAVSS
ncbi:MAG: hypothetical protein FJ290_26980, partial [Planctomycetes bacterium]|nr:hypothetical protein [Planctomycetota bacterium]